jgi:hypothetical protein
VAAWAYSTTRIQQDGIAGYVNRMGNAKEFKAEDVVLNIKYTPSKKA